MRHAKSTRISMTQQHPPICDAAARGGPRRPRPRSAVRLSAVTRFFSIRFSPQSAVPHNY
eukprot:3048425-Prymnesium_polylepis.6